MNTNKMCSIIASITVHQDDSWNVFFHDKEIPHTNALLRKFSDQTLTSDAVLEMIGVISKATVCPGNPEKKFVDFCRDKRGGVIRGERGSGPVVAYIDNVTATDHDGETLNNSVRCTDCDIMKLQDASRCKFCRDFRSTLRSGLCRQINNAISERTAARSHTPYCKLTTEEKDVRLSNLHDSLRLTEKKNRQLETKITTLIETQSMKLQDRDSADIAGMYAHSLS